MGFYRLNRPVGNCIAKNCGFVKCGSLFINHHSGLFCFRKNLKLKNETLKTQEKCQNSRKNSKIKKITQFIGIFICWPWGKDGQTIRLVYWLQLEGEHTLRI